MIQLWQTLYQSPWKEKNFVQFNHVMPVGYICKMWLLLTVWMAFSLTVLWSRQMMALSPHVQQPWGKLPAYLSLMNPRGYAMSLWWCSRMTRYCHSEHGQPLQWQLWCPSCWCYSSIGMSSETICSWWSLWVTLGNHHSRSWQRYQKVELMVSAFGKNTHNLTGVSAERSVRWSFLEKSLKRDFEKKEIISPLN